MTGLAAMVVAYGLKSCPAVGPVTRMCTAGQPPKAWRTNGFRQWLHAAGLGKGTARVGRNGRLGQGRYKIGRGWTPGRW